VTGSIASVLSGEAPYALIHGDCLDPVTGLASLPDRSVQHCITDPPYSQHTHDKQWIGAALTEQGAKRVKTSHAGLGFGHLTSDQAYEVAGHVSRSCLRWFLSFSDLEGIALWRDAVLNAGLDYVRTCVWDKVDGAPQFTGDRPAAGAEVFVVSHPSGRKTWNGGGKRNVYRHAVNGVKGDKPHPSTKPQSLMEELVADFTDPGDIVIDPFMGSGTTGVACLRLGRRFIGWEKDENYYEIACRRLRGDEAKPRPEQPSLFGGPEAA
jgi:site-specific DNA-methyltransferase (adenine-specific)